MFAVPKKNAFPFPELEKALFLIMKTQKYFVEIICPPKFVVCAKNWLSVNHTKRPTESVVCQCFYQSNISLLITDILIDLFILSKE